MPLSKPPTRCTTARASRPPGPCASFADAGETLPIRGDDVALIWPDGESAPYAWFAAPENDDGVFSVYYGGLAPVVPVEIEQRLLIDGLLYRIGSAQIPGTEAPRAWSVGLNRSDAVIDASGRSVEIPTAAKTRAVSARQRPSTAVEYGTGGATRNLDARMVVRLEGAWRNMSIRDLLDGIYAEADANFRYVATKGTALDGVMPTFDIGDFIELNRVRGLTQGAEIPSVSGSPELLWIAVAVPVGVPFNFYGLGAQNSGFNVRANVTADPVDTGEIDGVTYNIYVASYGNFPVSFASYVFFDRDSVAP